VGLTFGTRSILLPRNLLARRLRVTRTYRFSPAMTMVIDYGLVLANSDIFDYRINKNAIGLSFWIWNAAHAHAVVLWASIVDGRYSMLIDR